MPIFSHTANLHLGIYPKVRNKQDKHTKLEHVEDFPGILVLIIKFGSNLVINKGLLNKFTYLPM